MTSTTAYNIHPVVIGNDSDNGAYLYKDPNSSSPQLIDILSAYLMEIKFNLIDHYWFKYQDLENQIFIKLSQ